MKIGIATDDQINIAQHFGRTLGFVIVDIENGNIGEKEYRKNTYSNHMQGRDHEHGEHGHSHTSILEALKDCNVVLARGMGRRIYDDLRSVNIESMITDKITVDAALEAYLAGTLVDNPDKGCVH
ncbi:MAG: iron-molybdenum cofactor biosynthesis protein [Candidatus Marinimicrobia bacterium]|nr:iron-molybdenum cofactor biosynthesis protein [Candidatus Neomarinimicrobiota bacterium]